MALREAEEHKEIVRWYRETYPDYAMSLRVSQTGAGAKGGAKQFRWNAQKAKGAVVGEADICIALPRKGKGCLMLEHKADGSAHKATPAQLAYLEYHETIGNAAAVTRGIEAAKAAIRAYMEG